MNADIYERHRQAVEEWRSACEAVKLSEELRDRKRQALDNIGQELLASCADSAGKPEKKTRRKRTPKFIPPEGAIPLVNGKWAIENPHGSPKFRTNGEVQV